MRLHLFRVILFIKSFQRALSLHVNASVGVLENKDAARHAQMNPSAWKPFCRDNATSHRHILFAGDSFSRFMALALIEHLADNNTFCDVRNSPRPCQEKAKYFDSHACLEYRSRWCGAKDNMVPEIALHSAPIQQSFCDSTSSGGSGRVTNQVTVTALDMWDKRQFDNIVSPSLRHWSPDILVGSYMRSLSQSDDEFTQWLQQWCDLATKSGVKLIWVGNHARCMRKVPSQYGTQSNTIAKRRSSIARKVMEANGFQMLDPVEQDALNAAAVCKDTQDGTHVGMKSNMRKVESLIKMGILGDM